MAGLAQLLGFVTAAGHSWVLLTGSLAERPAPAVRVAAEMLARETTQ